MKKAITFAHWAIFALLLFFPIISCGGDGGDDDDSSQGSVAGDDADDDNAAGDDEQDYLDAIPSVDSLDLTIPESASKALGELATLYDETVDFSRDVNFHISGLLSIIDEITSYPPTGHDGETYIWGPWQDPYTPPTPVEMRFDMTRTADQTYDYYLRWRRKDIGGDWTDIWVGHTISSAETARLGQGNFSVDFTSAASLDPTLNETGSIEVVYDTVTDGRQIAVNYTEFFDSDEDMPAPVTATYQYVNHADNSGTFVFDWFGDIHWETYHGTEYALIEHSWFNTRWMSNGEGRSDVVIHDGDIPNIAFDDLHATEVDVSECWNDHFLRTFYTENILWDDASSSPAQGMPEGDESSCAFDLELPPKL
jgi:hypothetical protein